MAIAFISILSKISTEMTYTGFIHQESYEREAKENLNRYV